MKHVKKTRVLAVAAAAGLAIAVQAAPAMANCLTNLSSCHRTVNSTLGDLSVMSVSSRWPVTGSSIGTIKQGEAGNWIAMYNPKGHKMRVISYHQTTVLHDITVFPTLWYLGPADVPNTPNITTVVVIYSYDPQND